MKLDFIDMDDEESECNKLIRLYDFKCDEVAQIHGAILELAHGSLNEIAVHKLPYIGNAEIKLVLKPAAMDFGIWPTSGVSEFECRLTRGTWETVAGYMEPFLSSCDPNTFQWLDEPFQWTVNTSEICFLFTPDPNGSW